MRIRFIHYRHSFEFLPSITLQRFAGRNCLYIGWATFYIEIGPSEEDDED